MRAKLPIKTFLSSSQPFNRVARWHSIQKSQIGHIFDSLGMEIIVIFIAVWSILRPLHKFYCYLVNFEVNRYILPILVCFTKKNLATLNGEGVLPEKTKMLPSLFIF
jgi:hypothetical protein